LVRYNDAGNQWMDADFQSATGLIVPWSTWLHLAGMAPLRFIALRGIDVFTRTSHALRIGFPWSG
jgi:hypothetical protein